MRRIVKYSPGPWTLRQLPPGNDGESEPVFRIEAESTLFLTVAPCSDGFRFGENEANAQLIAAAPDLLAALQAIVAEYGDDLEPDCPFVLGALKAIAKATGERAE